MAENHQDRPNAGNFKIAFKPYLIRWSIIYAVFMAFITIIPVCISKPNWEFSQLLISWFMDIGAIFDGKKINYSVITLGINTFGIFALGAFSIGLITMGLTW